MGVVLSSWPMDLPSCPRQSGRMRTRVDLPAHLLSLAESQSGVLHHTQLTELSTGTLRRMRDQWVVLGNGLFCVTTPDWSSAVWAGLLRAGPGSVLGGAAASHLHGFFKSEPTTITVWVPGTSKPPLVVGKWTISFRRGQRRAIGSPARTRVEDTILDSAAELDEDSLVAVVSRALAQRRTTSPRMFAALSSRKRLRHRPVVRELCGVAGQGIESVLEWRYAERVERRHGLPSLERQAQLGGRERLDGLYREFGLAVELDGRQFHDATKDMHRDNLHALKSGVVTLRYGWHEVTREPCFVAAQVAHALSARGWRGTVRRCADCTPSLAP